MDFIRKLNQSSRDYRETGEYWNGNIYIQGFFYQETDDWNMKEAGEISEETYRVSILRNGPYILTVRYKVHEETVSQEAVDSRAAEKMRALPGIL